MTTSAVLAALNDNWQRLSAGSAARVQDWARREPELAGSHDLPGVLVRIRAHPDAVLAALLRLGATGDTIAYLAVLQAMLGRAVRLSGGRADVLAEAVSELWLAIREYPLDRRPRSIAANLGWAVQRRVRASPALVLPVGEQVAAETTPDASTTLTDARHLGLIDGLTHRTLWAVYVAGMTSAQAAVALGTTPELVRWRCSWAIRRLRNHAELLAA
ncbi:MAG TPA: hypothetical protein PKV13_03860 [Propionicimonas sp.]|nr:hypothetical protein [Propionicimonas sp.]HRA05736.1 hypothetical protein [Propionicimonas sp.]